MVMGMVTGMKAATGIRTPTNNPAKRATGPRIMVNGVVLQGLGHLPTVCSASVSRRCTQLESALLIMRPLRKGGYYRAPPA